MAHSPSRSSGFTRIIRAFGYSCEGLLAAWKNEAAFRQEVVATVICVPLALWLGQTAVERALLAGSVLLVLIAELVNSAVEAVVDLASPEKHELAKRAKDIGSAAVLLALLIAALTWALILWPLLSARP